MSTPLYELSSPAVISDIDVPVRTSRLIDYCYGPDILFTEGIAERNTLWVMEVDGRTLNLTKPNSPVISINPALEHNETILAISFAIGLDGLLYFDVETVIDNVIQDNHEYVYTRTGTTLTLVSHNRIPNRTARSYLYFDKTKTACNGVVRFLGDETSIKVVGSDNLTEPELVTTEQVSGYLWQVAKGSNTRTHILMRPR